MPEIQDVEALYFREEIFFHHSLEAGHCICKVFNLKGILVLNELVALEAKRGSIPANLSTGIYSLYLETTDVTVSGQFFVA